MSKRKKLKEPSAHEIIKRMVLAGWPTSDLLEVMELAGMGAVIVSIPDAGVVMLARDERVSTAILRAAEKFQMEGVEVRGDMT